MDSLKYASVKFNILDEQGKYKEALHSYKEFSAMLERYQSELIFQRTPMIFSGH